MKLRIFLFGLIALFVFGVSSLIVSYQEGFDDFVFKVALAQECDEKDTWEICYDDGTQCWYQVFCDPGQDDCTPTECPKGGGNEM